MTNEGLEREITTLLASVNRIAGYPLSLVCTEQGLLVAAAGDARRTEIVGGLTSLFDDIVRRATRDLGFSRVDELTLTDADGTRYVIRPLPLHAGSRLFLVVLVPQKNTWRKYTNLLCTQLTALLDPFMKQAAPEGGHDG